MGRAASAAPMDCHLSRTKTPPKADGWGTRSVALPQALTQPSEQREDFQYFAARWMICESWGPGGDESRAGGRPRRATRIICRVTKYRVEWSVLAAVAASSGRGRSART